MQTDTVTDRQAPASKPARILFLDKVMAGPFRESPRGVELFNLNLLRDLGRQGHEITALVHTSWQPAIRATLDGTPMTLESPPAGRTSSLPPGWLRKVATRQRADVLLLGNVANRLIPALILLRLLRSARRCVLVAHREPSRRSIWTQKTWPSTILAVNQIIAQHYLRNGFSDVSVDYGITDAERFYPSTQNRETDGGTVHFCVAGNLDSAWKGSDMAVSAFQGLSRELRHRCRLHLASFHKQPVFDDKHIIPYPWLPAGEMPDFFRRMDVMIVPSRDEGVMRETFSQVMVQGMLSGLPVIANQLPVLREKLDTGGGLVVNNVPAMTAAMARLAANADERRSMGRTARDTALQRYVWDSARFAQRYL